MDAATDRALAVIDRAVAEARENATLGPVRLPHDYLEAVSHVERMVENQSGADKTWLGRAEEAFRAHFARARRR